MKEIRTIADRKGLKIVEDAAHCLEGSRDGIRPGELSDTACFSFYANKSITSGEGGAVITNDDYLAERLRRLRLHGLEKKAESRYSNKYQPYDILELGWKYNMDNIQAALLINQLKRINALRERKEKIWKMYVDSFSGENMLRLQKVGSSVEHAMHIFNIRTDIEIRNALIHHLEKKGIGVSVHFIPAHQLTFFRKTFGWKEGMFPKAEEFSKRSISLPIYPGLKTEEAKYIIETVIEGIHEIAT
jgi:UDP-4-amino-4-deoxy-L-arabinose-oxoglutarate aminotransferase